MSEPLMQTRMVGDGCFPQVVVARVGASVMGGVEAHFIPASVAISHKADPAFPKLLVCKFLLHLANPSGQAFPA